MKKKVDMRKILLNILLHSCIIIIIIIIFFCKNNFIANKDLQGKEKQVKKKNTIIQPR